jgi:hypothetical protein
MKPEKLAFFKEQHLCEEMNQRFHLVIEARFDDISVTTSMLDVL